MIDQDYITTLEKRLENTEKALITLWSLLEDLHPPETQRDINEMLHEYYDANCLLGSECGNSAEFQTP